MAKLNPLQLRIRRAMAQALRGVNDLRKVIKAMPAKDARLHLKVLGFTRKQSALLLSDKRLTPTEAALITVEHAQRQNRN